jgi:uncharacterized peroxidase-related enzyme
LLRLTKDAVLVDALTRNWASADLSPADRAMLVYTEKLTSRPAEMIERDVVVLREAGFSDAAILDIGHVAGYYAYANRLADGLGVELESKTVSEQTRG